MINLFKMKRTVFVLTLCIGISLSFIPSFAQGAGNLANKHYKDPKGYFKILPPGGWRIQEYPQDPRGKVAFLAPGGKIDLRILVNSVDYSTVDELVSFCNNIEKRIGINTNIKRVVFGGQPAVQRNFELKGFKLLYIDFLVGQLDHNLAYSAPKDSFKKYLQIVKTSMETYEPSIKSLTEEQKQQHLVAKKKRLAELMIEGGNYSMAIQFANEGLEIDPNNRALLELRKKAKAHLK